MDLKQSDLYPHLSGLPLNNYNNATPVLLLGLDNIHLAIPSAVKEAGEYLSVAIKTKLGWVAYGPSNAHSITSSTVIIILIRVKIFY